MDVQSPSSVHETLEAVAATHGCVKSVHARGVSRHEYPSSISTFTLCKQHKIVPAPLASLHFVGCSSTGLVMSLNFNGASSAPAPTNGKRKREADADDAPVAKVPRAPAPQRAGANAAPECGRSRDVDAAIERLRARRLDPALLERAANKIKRYWTDTGKVVESWSLYASAKPTDALDAGAPAPAPLTTELPKLVFGVLFRPGAPVRIQSIVSSFEGLDGMLTTKDLKSCNLPMGEPARAACALGVVPLRLYVSL